MKVYIESNNKFYEFEDVGQNLYHLSYPDKPIGMESADSSDKLDFEIGSHVYFIDKGWTEVVVESVGCARCIFTSNTSNSTCPDLICGRHIRKDGKNINFISLNKANTTEKELNQFLVFNHSTLRIFLIKESEKEARKEAERLALQNQGVEFSVLKMIGTVTAETEAKWK